MHKEIGSEFEAIACTPAGADAAWLSFGADRCLTFSGRTAIEHVLEEIGPGGKACLPSYCCDSMIEPFRRANMEICFYPVDYRNGLAIDFDIPSDCRVLLYCRYFGFDTPRVPAEITERLHRGGGFLVEDFTHSLLSGTAIHEECDYAVASLRKWFPLLSGGMSVKMRGAFCKKTSELPDISYISLKTRAMQQKRAYIDAGYSGDKDTFLALYAQANAWLREHYSDLAMDEPSRSILAALDREAIRTRRIENAKVLYRELCGLKDLTFLFEEGQMDCPLFVPVLLEKERREQVRRTLIQAAAYCPVHWPVPCGECRSTLYERELSLVCDQRYDEEDMQHMAEILRGCCG